MIVGVTGYARHGKDTVGRRLVDRWGYQRVALADGLREMALKLNPIVGSVERVRYRDNIQSGREDVARWTDYKRLAKLVEDIGWEGAKKDPEVRRILQVLGTECVRDMIGEDSWVKVLESRLAPANFAGDKAVITDVRFPNEAEWVHRVGGVMIRVTRPNLDNGVATDHPSERYVPDLPVDYRIVNDGTLADLNAVVDRIAADLGDDPEWAPPAEWKDITTHVQPDRPGRIGKVTILLDNKFFAGHWCGPDCQTNRDDGYDPRPGDALDCD